MLYVFPLTVKDTGGCSSFAYAAKIGERWRTLISLLQPDMPKKACQIHRSYDATASSIMEAAFPRPVNMPFHAVGQFLHSQCIQSRLPSIPGKPRREPTSSRRATSAVFGALRYTPSNAEITARQNICTAKLAVESPMRTYSSTASAGIPYAKIRIAATYFCIADNPSFPVQLARCLNQGSISSTAFTIRRNTCFLMRYLRVRTTGNKLVK